MLMSFPSCNDVHCIFMTSSPLCDLSMKVDCKDEVDNMCDITMWMKVGNTNENCKNKRH